MMLVRRHTCVGNQDWSAVDAPFIHKPTKRGAELATLDKACPYLDRWFQIRLLFESIRGWQPVLQIHYYRPKHSLLAVQTSAVVTKSHQSSCCLCDCWKIFLIVSRLALLWAMTIIVSPHLVQTVAAFSLSCWLASRLIEMYKQLSR